MRYSERDYSQMNLSTAFERILAALVDAAILVPISEMCLRLIPAKTGDIFVSGILIYTILYESYAIVLNWKLGGTFGKLLLGLKINSVTGGAITLSQSFRRSSVDLMLQLIHIAELYILIKGGNIEAVPNVSMHSMRSALYDHKNVFTDVMVYLEIGWLLSEFITMQFNSQKRALHDFIAGTIVLTHERRNKVVKSIIWVSSILILSIFFILSLGANDETTSNIHDQASLWEPKSIAEIHSVLKMNGIYPGRVNPLGQNILHIATKRADTRSFILFLQAYPELINSSDFFGDTPSHLALRFSPEKYAVIKNSGLIERKANRFGESNMR
ncbi:MAG: RDD family protein [Turneriella sp.]